MGCFSQPHRVVIIDPDLDHAGRLEQALASKMCSVWVVSQATLPLQRSILDSDVVIFVAKSPFLWKAELARLFGFASECARPPALLCVLRWPSRGPEDRLYGDLYDAKVIHEG